MKFILSNTVLGFAAGSALVLLVQYARMAATSPPEIRRAWSWTFGMLGLLLATVGFHTIVAWPLIGAGNLIFGDPALVGGGLLLAAAFVVARTPVEAAPDDLTDDELGASGSVEDLPAELAVALRPLAWVAAFAGLMVILLGWAGGLFSTYVFRPPASEFPAGLLAGTGLEIVYMVGTYTLLGVGAILFPFSLERRSLRRPTAYLFVVSGVLILLITMASFVGHVTLSAGAGPGGLAWPP
ncbi:MAG: DUF981 family protein [Halobacteriaceae archaeon]